MNMQKTEYRCVGGCVGGWENDSLVLTLDRQKKTTLSGTSTSTSTADDARPYEGLKTAMHGPMKANRYSKQYVNRNDVNSSTVLVSNYKYEHAEDRIPVCRGVCRVVGK